MPQFSTHESVSLDKNVELKENDLKSSSYEQIDDLYEVQRCADWIETNGFKKVCLQFPDHLLPDSSDVALKLQEMLGQTVYILGDTAYESCCIDYVAAAHIDSDAIIHFGPTCFSKTSNNVPYLNIYEKHPIDLETFKNCIDKFEFLVAESYLILLDDVYIHQYENIKRICDDKKDVEVRKIVEDIVNMTEKTVIFVGGNSRKILNVDLSFKPKYLHQYNPTKPPPIISPYQPDSRILKRRYFLMEKIKDASTIGIVIGTLGVENYLKVIDRVKKLCQMCGKKYYLISVGKPTVAKLANLGEVDIYVLITCSMNEIYDSRDYYKPIVTPYDVEMALNANSKDIHFSFDYNKYLNRLEDLSTLKPPEQETDVSLITGKLRSNIAEPEKEEINSDGQIVLRSAGTVGLSSNFGAGYLNERTWKGLDQDLDNTEVKKAEEGRSGIASSYQNEHIS